MYYWFKCPFFYMVKTSYSKVGRDFPHSFCLGLSLNFVVFWNQGFRDKIKKKNEKNSLTICKGEREIRRNRGVGIFWSCRILLFVFSLFCPKDKSALYYFQATREHMRKDLSTPHSILESFRAVSDLTACIVNDEASLFLHPLQSFL